MPYNIILSNPGPGYPGRVSSHPAKVPPAGSCFFERSEINGLGNGPFRFLVDVGGSAQWQKLHGGVAMDEMREGGAWRSLREQDSVPGDGNNIRPRGVPDGTLSFLSARWFVCVGCWIVLPRKEFIPCMDGILQVASEIPRGRILRGAVAPPRPRAGRGGAPG